MHYLPTPSFRPSLLIGMRLLTTALLLAVGLAGAQTRSATPLDSDAILSGLGPFTRESVWPETIYLPAEWQTGIRALLELQRATGKEHASCLSVSTQTGLDVDTTALQDYSKLRADRARLAPAEFSRQERLLRQKIEGSGSAAASRSLAWQMGRAQSGREHSVKVGTDSWSCEGGNLGIAHTHPNPNAGAPSESDTINILLDQDSRLSVMTASSLESCVLIRGVGRTGDVSTIGRNNFNFGPYLRGNETNAFESRVAYFVFHSGLLYTRAQEFATTRTAYPPEAQLPMIRRLSASVLATIGGKVYCGRLSDPLKRMDPYAGTELVDAVKQGEKPALVLALKAAIIMLHRLDKRGWLPQPRFSFSPSWDPELAAYLRSLPPAPEPGEERIAQALRDDAGEEIGQISLAGLFRLVLMLMHSDDSFPAILETGFEAPDDRSLDKVPDLKIQYGCSAENYFFFCKVAEINSQGEVSIIAEYLESVGKDFRKSTHLFRDRKTGVMDQGPSYVYAGELAAATPAGVPQMHGKGVLKLSNLVFNGEFNRGTPTTGLLTQKATGVTSRAQYQKDGWKLLP